MKDEVKAWLTYARENHESAEILIKSELFNPALQNIQQSIEKFLKALLIEKEIKLKRTHSINELISQLAENSCIIDIQEDDIDLIDSIYLPSKYPLGNALPDYTPDEKICKHCLEILNKVRMSVNDYLSS